MHILVLNAGSSSLKFEAIEPAMSRPALVVWGNIQRWITLLLVGALLLGLAPAWIQRLATTVQSKPLPSLGWGAVTMLVVGALAIAIPVATIILTTIFSDIRSVNNHLQGR